MSGKHAESSDDEKLWAELGLDVELHRRVVESIAANYARQVESRPRRPAGDGLFRRRHPRRPRRPRPRNHGQARPPGRNSSGRSASMSPRRSCSPSTRHSCRPLRRDGRLDSVRRKAFPPQYVPSRQVHPRTGLFRTPVPTARSKIWPSGRRPATRKKRPGTSWAKDGGFHVLEVPQKKGPADRRSLARRGPGVRRPDRGIDREQTRSGRLAEAVRLMNRKRRALGPAS